jgi:hypothetical protein
VAPALCVLLGAALIAFLGLSFTCSLLVLRHLRDSPAIVVIVVARASAGGLLGQMPISLSVHEHVDSLTPARACIHQNLDGLVEVSLLDGQPVAFFGGRMRLLRRRLWSKRRLLTSGCLSAILSQLLGFILASLLVLSARPLTSAPTSLPLLL